MHRFRFSLAAFVYISGFSAAVSAAVVPVQITVENLAPQNSVSLAPLRFGFGNGAFDAFDEGQAAFLLGFPSIAEAPIVTIAEGGSGSNWFPAFLTAESAADTGSVVGPTGPFLPGQSNSTIIMVDNSNRYFTFGTMVVPSNDHFLGNDDPQEYEVFDSSGNLILTSITQTAAEIWDAGSETENPANAAFLVGGVNSQRENENGVVSFNFSDLSTFDGLTTAAGYVFDSSLLSADTDVLRISFAVVPEPVSSSLLLSVCGAMLAGRRGRHVRS